MTHKPPSGLGSGIGLSRIKDLTEEQFAQLVVGNWRSSSRGYSCVETNGHRPRNVEGDDVAAAIQMMGGVDRCVVCGDVITHMPPKAPVPRGGEALAAPVVERPDPLMLRNFRLRHGRSPNTQELRALMKPASVTLMPAVSVKVRTK